MSGGSQQSLAGARVTAQLQNVTETGAEVVGDVLTVTSTAPLQAAWQAAAGGSFVQIAGDSMTGDLTMTAGADVNFDAGSNAIFDAGSYLEFGGDTYVQRYAAALLAFPGTALRVEGFQPAQFSENAAINCAAGGVHATPGSVASGAFAAGVSGDANPRAVIRAGGLLAFGDGTFDPGVSPGVSMQWLDSGRVQINNRVNIVDDCTAQKFVGSDVARMLHASGGGYAEFDSGGAGTQFLLARAAGDAQNRWQILNNGEMRIGGGTFVPDVRFRRPAAVSGVWHQYQGQLSHADTLQVVSFAGTTVLDEWDDVILVDSATAGIVLQLSGGMPAGKMLIVKDIGANASVNNITLDPNGFQIEGVAANYLITSDGGSVTLRYDGADWWIVGAYP